MLGISRQQRCVQKMQKPQSQLVNSIHDSALAKQNLSVLLSSLLLTDVIL
jgi:hypothetical protein